MTYTYKCEICGEFEAEQSIKDEPFDVCPTCGFHSVQRLISGSGGFVLKGDGWAKDCYAPRKENH